jgi:hypothetical protein
MSTRTIKFGFQRKSSTNIFDFKRRRERSTLKLHALFLPSLGKISIFNPRNFPLDPPINERAKRGLTIDMKHRTIIDPMKSCTSKLDCKNCQMLTVKETVENSVTPAWI